MISGSNWLKGVPFATFAILAMKEATSTTSENERRPEVMRSLCSFYANDVLWVLIFEEEQISYNQTTRPPRKFKKCQFYSRFTRRSLFYTISKKRFYSSHIFVSSGDPICVSCVFGNLNFSPKMGDFSSFWRTKNGLETRISYDFQHFILTEHVNYLFFMP